MEEERVKSALEIAMERISGMPELTLEEIAEQKIKEYRPVGEALGNKYMQDIIHAERLRVELNKHSGDSRRIVLEVLVSNLCRSIQLDDFQASGKALNGLLGLTEERDGFREDVHNRWDRILLDFERRMEEKSGELDIAATESFKNLGISGSAIRPNLSADALWRRGLEDLYRSFEPELEKLRDMLTRKFQVV